MRLIIDPIAFITYPMCIYIRQNYHPGYLVAKKMLAAVF